MIDPNKPYSGVMESIRDREEVLGKPNVSRETSQRNLWSEVVVTPNKAYSEVMRESKEMENQITEVARLAGELHEALKALTGPSGRMTSYWNGKPSDWPENLPWGDEHIARASSAVGSLVLSEGDWE